MTSTPPDVVTDVATLERLYGAPSAPSIVKETRALTPSYRAMIEASPFLVLATVGPDGLDCSPRGDAPGFVHVQDAATLLLPDRRGNNRVDSLRNVIYDPRVALLFFVPGVDETLRVNGRATLRADAASCARFAVDGRLPRTVLEIAVDAVFFQCTRALVRSGLWDATRQVARATVPSPGAMLAEASAGSEGGAAYDAGLAARQRATLY